MTSDPSGSARTSPKLASAAAGAGTAAALPAEATTAVALPALPATGRLGATGATEICEEAAVGATAGVVAEAAGIVAAGLGVIVATTAGVGTVGTGVEAAGADEAGNDPTGWLPALEGDATAGVVVATIGAVVGAADATEDEELATGAEAGAVGVVGAVTAGALAAAGVPAESAVTAGVEAVVDAMLVAGAAVTPPVLDAVVWLAGAGALGTNPAPERRPCTQAIKPAELLEQLVTTGPTMMAAMTRRLTIAAPTVTASGLVGAGSAS